LARDSWSIASIVTPRPSEVCRGFPQSKCRVTLQHLVLYPRTCRWTRPNRRYIGYAVHRHSRLSRSSRKCTVQFPINNPPSVSLQEPVEAWGVLWPTPTSDHMPSISEGESTVISSDPSVIPPTPLPIPALTLQTQPLYRQLRHSWSQISPQPNYTQPQYPCTDAQQRGFGLNPSFARHAHRGRDISLQFISRQYYKHARPSMAQSRDTLCCKANILVTTFDKLLENLMYKRLYTFISDNILYEYQFGFRKNYSTTLGVIDVIDNI